MPQMPMPVSSCQGTIIFVVGHVLKEVGENTGIADLGSNAFFVLPATQRS